MKNLGLIAMVLLLITGCIENNSSNASDEEQKEVVSTSNELKNPPRVESPADANLREGEEFLTENGKKEGVVTLESGMQYKVLIPGTGAIPIATDKVNVHYHGTLIDGTVFDSSVDRNQPAQFNVSGVIRGWTEVLQLMNVGSKFRVYVPQELAYGANPQPGGPIQPFSALIFDIDLLDIK